MSRNQDVGRCILQSIPPPIFGELVLRLLNSKDVCKLDTAICQSSLRKYWWIGAQAIEGSNQHIDGCLHHAVNPKHPIKVSSAHQVEWLHKRQQVCSSYIVDTKLDNYAFKLLLDTTESMGLLLHSLVLERTMDSTKSIFYLEALANCKHLRALSISSRQDNLVKVCNELISNNPQLSTLTLHLDIIRSFSRSLQNAKSLKHLCISSMQYLGTPEDLVPLRSQLESFSMLRFYSMTRPVLLAMFDGNGSNPLMRHVVLSQKGTTHYLHLTLDNSVVRMVATSCPNLETLDISAARRDDKYNGAVSDDTIEFLAQQCSRLRILHLSHNCKITSASVDAVLAGCPEISEIYLYGTSVDHEYLHSRYTNLKEEGRFVRFYFHETL